MSSNFKGNIFKILFSIAFPIILVVIIFSVYLFDKLLDEKKVFLYDKSIFMAEMISNIAAFDREFSHEHEDVFNNLSSNATIFQVQNTLQLLRDSELQLEYLVGAVNKDTIEFIAYSANKPPSVNLEDENIAIPMRKALAGQDCVGIE